MQRNEKYDVIVTGMRINGLKIPIIVFLRMTGMSVNQTPLEGSV